MQRFAWVLFVMTLVSNHAIGQEVLPDERDGELGKAKVVADAKADFDAVQLGGLPLFVDPDSVVATNVFLKRESVQDPESAKERFLTLQIDMPKELSAWEVQQISHFAEMAPSGIVALGAEEARSRYLVSAVTGLLDVEIGAGCFYQKAVQDLPPRLLVHFPAARFVEAVKQLDHQVPIGTVAKVRFEELTTAVSSEISPEERALSERQLSAEGLSLNHFVQVSDSFAASIPASNADFSVLGSNGPNVVAYCAAPTAATNAENRFFGPISSSEYIRLSKGSELWKDYSLYLGTMPEEEAFSHIPLAARVVGVSSGLISVQATDEMIAKIRQSKLFYVAPRTKK